VAPNKASDFFYHSFWAVFEFGAEVPATPIAHNVLEICTPPGIEAGPMKFWVIYRENASKRVLQQTNPSLFNYLPTDPSGKIAINFAKLLPFGYGIQEIICKYKYAARELDLSNNSLSNIQFLLGFRFLHTLILDHNAIMSNTTFPRIQQLTGLSVNNNFIRELEPLVKHLLWAFPNLERLSLEGNEAWPPNNKPHIHYNYRIYCVSKFKNLQVLDSVAVTHEERQHAACISDDES